MTMGKLWALIRREPVRTMAVATILVGIVARYVADFPTDAVLGLLAAVLGVGSEVARAKVTPTVKPGTGPFSDADRYSILFQDDAKAEAYMDGFPHHESQLTATMTDPITPEPEDVCDCLHDYRFHADGYACEVAGCDCAMFEDDEG